MPSSAARGSTQVGAPDADHRAKSLKAVGETVVCPRFLVELSGIEPPTS
jgi:hypothetical protein